MEQRIKEILIDIYEKTYNKKPEYFRLEIIPQEMKSFHGDYTPRTKTIRIFNISRPIDHIVSTTIHELAHHADCTFYGSSGHNKRFYGIFRDLMTTAIECGYVDYNIVRNKKDSLDIQQMEKYYGPLIARYDESKDNHKDECIIKVFKSFNIKDFLKANGFKYNAIEKTWDKTEKKENVDKIKEEILAEDSSVEVVIKDYNDITLDAFYYVVVSKNTYEHKDQLSANGYRYKGYNIQTNSWVKKVKTSEVKKEESFLEQLGLSYKLKN